MRNTLYPFALFAILAGFTSCEKSTEADLDELTAELEAKAAGKVVLAIGMEYQGGIIFKLDETGKHGKIVAKTDLGPARWGCFGTEITEARDYYNGWANTQAILAACPESGIAARLCTNYVVRDKGNAGKKYRDWYMPSFAEFSEVVSTLKSAANACNKTYWCSTEEPAGFMASPVNLAERVNQHHVACAVSDPNSWGFFRSPVSKSGLNYVRPVRAF